MFLAAGLAKAQRLWLFRRPDDAMQMTWCRKLSVMSLAGIRWARRLPEELSQHIEYK
jgi:hypothetical protein